MAFEKSLAEELDTESHRPGAGQRLEFLKRNGVWGKRLFLSAVLAWFSFLVLFPVVEMILGAFRNGFVPFLTALQTPAARHAFWLTFWISVISVLVNTFFGLILALVLAQQDFRGKALVNGLVDLPLAVSPVVAGFMFIILFGKNGWLGHWFEQGGIQIVFAVPGMILATIFVSLPFVVREVVPVLKECGLEQEEAARTLGASRWHTFWRVTLPSIRWGLAYGITLTTARSLGEFGAVLVLSGSIIGSTQTATLHVHQEFNDFHFQGAFSASLVLAVVSFSLLIIMELLKKKQWMIGQGLRE
jgi:sulfate transport system permease protein